MNWEAYDDLHRRREAAQLSNRVDASFRKPRLVSLSNAEASEAVGQLQFPLAAKPVVSIVIPFWNNPTLTLECLISIAEQTQGVEYEVVLVDDGSEEACHRLLSTVPNVVYIRNASNCGFSVSCNRGAQAARGQYLVFLNNDAQVQNGWLTALLKVFEEDWTVGVVGPKVVFPNGVLQEAGATINQDCTTTLIGCGEDPDSPCYTYAREVDYCSGVCLAVPTELFREVGGFDVAFSPAYCEDVDLCLKIHSQRRRICYQPAASIVHHLSKTSAQVSSDFKLRLAVKNQQLISERWQPKIDQMNQVRLIAFYLPQFHPIPENNLWWGKGFTEWRNVTRAKPNFRGHYQPRLPADLGFYDLRLRTVMEDQWALAKRYGVHGFCYYYYWFSGKRLLEQPLRHIMEAGREALPFCLAWANENWTRRWDGRENEVLMGQDFAVSSVGSFVSDILPYLKHPSYIRINEKPLFLIYRLDLFTDPRAIADQWREHCRQKGVGEIYLAFVESFRSLHTQVIDPNEIGFDASVEFPPHGAVGNVPKMKDMLNKNFRGAIFDYEASALEFMRRRETRRRRFRGVMPSWDNTARRQDDGVVFVNSSPGAYQAWLESVLLETKHQNCGDERLVFINAWNEWAEGAYLEPDARYGHRYLEATRAALERTGSLG